MFPKKVTQTNLKKKVLSNSITIFLGIGQLLSKSCHGFIARIGLTTNQQRGKACDQVPTWTDNWNITNKRWQMHTLATVFCLGSYDPVLVKKQTVNQHAIVLGDESPDSYHWTLSTKIPACADQIEAFIFLCQIPGLLRLTQFLQDGHIELFGNWNPQHASFKKKTNISLTWLLPCF